LRKEINRIHLRRGYPPGNITQFSKINVKWEDYSLYAKNIMQKVSNIYRIFGIVRDKMSIS